VASRPPGSAERRHGTVTNMEFAPTRLTAAERKARQKNYDQKRNSKERGDDIPERAPKVKVIDTEIFVVTQRLMLREGSDLMSGQIGFVQKGQRVAIRKTGTAPTMPPTERLQVATPGEPATLGWINAEKQGEPTTVPEAVETPVAAPAVEMPVAAPAVESRTEKAAPPEISLPPTSDMEITVDLGDGSFIRKRFENFWARANAKVMHATLAAVFFKDKVDKSDAALAARFKAIDADKSGSISTAELRTYILRLYPGADKSIVAVMMKAADTNGDGEVDLTEFKTFMRAMPDRAPRARRATV